MIPIELNLFVTLARYRPGGTSRFEVEKGTTVTGLMALLGIEADMVKLIFINGKKADPETVIQANDRVGLFPPVGGG